MTQLQDLVSDMVVPPNPEELARQKYEDDPIFRSLVDGQMRLLQSGNYTMLDLALASALAQIIAACRV